MTASKAQLPAEKVLVNMTESGGGGRERLDLRLPVALMPDPEDASRVLVKASFSGLAILSLMQGL